MVGWMDAEEQLGLAPHVMDMPHEVKGEGHDRVGPKMSHTRRKRLMAARDNPCEAKMGNGRRKQVMSGPKARLEKTKSV
jgi:hypothetical protein